VSGQNVVFVGAGALALAYLLGFGRLTGEAAAAASIVAYVLAVGLQPSVVRAGIAGILGSLAWLAARQRDRWYALLLGALVLLAWNPFLVRDPGFQLSFAAVAAIFTLAPAIVRALDGWPVPGFLADTIAISTACGVATAPIVWLQFHAIPLLAIPANLLVAPVVPPLLWLAFATVALAALAPAAAPAIAVVNGWCAAYLATCARAVAAVPGAQVTSGRGAAAAAGIALLVTAYACRRGQRAEAGLPPRRQRPAEDRARGPAAARAGR
jgi:competence protein ComEC